MISDNKNKTTCSYSIYQLFGKYGNCRVFINSFSTPEQCLYYLKILQFRYPEARFATVFKQKENALQTSDIDSQPQLPF